MKRLGILALGALAVAGASCASYQSPPYQDPDAERAGEAYGAFLAAQYAGHVSDSQAASSYYRTALDAAPAEDFVRERAFMSSLVNGELDEGARLGEQLLGHPTSDRLARVLLASRAVKNRRYDRAVELLDGHDLGPFNRVIGSLVLAWAYEGLDAPDKALRSLDAPDDAPILGHLMTLHRALVLERAGRQDEAETVYKEALDFGLMRSIVVEAYGRRLERAGREDEARRLYTEQLDQSPNDPSAKSGLERIEQGRRPAAFAETPAQGASMAVFGPAATLASNAPSDLAVIYLRLALYLDPDNGVARQLLGDMLSRAQLDLDALAVYSEADSVSPFYVSSKIAEAATLLRLERPDEAVGILTALVRETDSDRARRALADALSGIERYDEAIAIYSDLVAKAEASDDPPDWQLYYSRGFAYEQAGQWSLAEADLEHALEIAPNQAAVLNNLGYVWVDRGEHIEEAFDMIRRAVALEPNAGYIIDSLGWAHFKRGEFDAAIEHLERAVELDPQDPTINDHLGDAYWRVGRLLEASYQWRRSLTLEPSDDLRVTIEQKLANGLPPVDEPLIASP